MSQQMLSDGQCVDLSRISKVELFEKAQNLLLTLKNGRMVGVHGHAVIKDADLLENARDKEGLKFLVHRKRQIVRTAPNKISE